jgi:hypothetical protein
MLQEPNADSYRRERQAEKKHPDHELPDDVLNNPTVKDYAMDNSTLKVRHYRKLRSQAIPMRTNGTTKSSQTTSSKATTAKATTSRTTPQIQARPSLIRAHIT